MTAVAVFNNKGGVGKTSLVYHLAWMYRELGKRVLVADLDPQANLTSMFLDDDAVEELWAESGERNTIHAALLPLLDGVGDVASPSVQEPSPGIGLVAGDMLLSGAEDELSNQWPDCLDRKPRAFRVLTALSRVVKTAALDFSADLILLDVGPNLGALNRAALIAADHVVVPLAPDLYSIQGLRNLGPTLRRWREQWSDRRSRNPVADLGVPEGAMQPIGYVVLQHAVRLDRPVKAYERWMERIPGAYCQFVLDEPGNAAPPVAEDSNCLGTLKHFRSLMPLAQEARKPMFLLRAADGAIGGHANAVNGCYLDFQALAGRVATAAAPGGLQPD